MPNITIRPAWDASYHILNAAAPKRLAILLHGFQQTGEFMAKVLHEAFDSQTVVVAPNAPFPIPFKRGKAPLRMGYSWYIWDEVTGEYLVEIEQAIAYVSELINALGYSELPTKVIGFSQGGYVAPFLAEQLPKVTQVLGINCRYRDERITGPFPFRTDAVQAELDKMINPQRAQSCHEAVIAKGNTGTFKLVPDTGHMFSSRLVEGIKEVLALSP